MAPAQGAAPALPATSVHDTVAAIARRAVYDRSIGSTAWQDFWSFIGRVLSRVFEFFRGSNASRHITLVVAALIAAAVIIHFVLTTYAARGEPAADAAKPAGGHRPDAWREAERLAAAGLFTDASHALLAALLAAFARRGEVRLHASKTAGDYARELARRGSPARSAFQQFRRRYDAVIFGTGACDADEYAALLRDAAPMLSPGAGA